MLQHGSRRVCGAASARGSRLKGASATPSSTTTTTTVTTSAADSYTHAPHVHAPPYHPPNSTTTTAAQRRPQPHPHRTQTQPHPYPHTVTHHHPSAPSLHYTNHHHQNTRSMSPVKDNMIISRKDNMEADQRALNALHPDARPHPLTAACPRPIPNSYWATPLLLACEYPWAPGCIKPKLDALLTAGVRTFIDLTEPHELRPYAGACLAQRAALLGIDATTIEYHNFPIHDRALPSSVSYMCSILSVLRDAQDRGRISAVHCRGGIGRTGMVVGCWLVEAGLARDGEDALRRIAQEWKTVEKCTRFPHSPETGAQFEFVKNYQKAAASAR